MKRRALQETGLTLIELIVAMAILAILTALVAFVFNDVGKAVNLTDQQMARDVGLQVLTQRMRDDIRSINRDGFLCVVQGTEVWNAAGVFCGYNRPPAIVFTATRSYSAADPNDLGKANAALVAYVPCSEIGAGVNIHAPLPPGSMPAQMASGFARYVYLLSGNWIHPRHVVELGPVIDPNLPNRLGDSLADASALAPFDASQALLQAGLYVQDVWPFAQQMVSLNITPRTRGDLNVLWPYLVGGYRNIRIDFQVTYGAEPNTGVMDWRSPKYCNGVNDTLGDANRPLELRSARLPGRIPFIIPNAGNPIYNVLWTGRDKGAWPRALKMTMTTYDFDGKPFGLPCETVFDLQR